MNTTEVIILLYLVAHDSIFYSRHPLTWKISNPDLNVWNCNISKGMN